MGRTNPQAEVDRFNDRYPVGTKVRYWSGMRTGAGAEGIISHPASVLGGHTAVAWIEGARGCIGLTHVEKEPS